MNISTVDDYAFAHCQSMQKIQMITNNSGCSNYTIKYIRNIDAQNYVVVCTDSHNNGKLVIEGTFYTIQNSPLQKK